MRRTTSKARLKDTNMQQARQADLYITIARAWSGLEEWKKSLSAFREAHRVFNDDKNKGFRRKILIFEARAAEMAKDYNRAVYCWSELIPTYGKEEADWANRARGNIRRLQPLARKNNKVEMGSLNDDDKGEDISLDE